uniref:Bm7377 n=1 Tax=Brugia malayi TaxID=6279 RepID=A0A0J9XR65_BRUMA|nr:Bm7377 [Brugia malayi]
MTNSTTATALHPLVQWAQRDKLLYLTIEIDNVVDLQITEKGTYGGSKALYEATLDFYAGVKTDYRKIANDRHLELVINKETASWWPRLSKSSAKLPWVKVDFNKWKDEDEDEDDMNGGDLDFQNYMSKLDAGGAGAPNLDDFDDDDEEDGDDGIFYPLFPALLHSISWYFISEEMLLIKVFKSSDFLVLQICQT